MGARSRSVGPRRGSQVVYHKAKDWTENVLREHDDGGKTLAWNQRLTLELLHTEAEALIGTVKSQSQSPTTNNVYHCYPKPAND